MEKQINNIMNTPFSIIFKSALVSFLAEWYGFIWDLRWMIIFGIILVFCDFWFGISESKYKKKKITWSLARNKTLVKSVDYLCYLTLGIAMGKSLAQPYGLDPIVIATTVILACYLFELNSIYLHICHLHDIEPRYDLWDFAFMLVTFKFKKFGIEFNEIVNQLRSAIKNKHNNE